MLDKKDEIISEILREEKQFGETIEK